METVIEVDESNFNEKVVEQSKNKLVVVDFWASWCTPCLMLSPILEKLAKEYNGKFVLAKLDVSKNQKLAQEYSVMSIPNVKLFKDGKVVDEFVGTMPEPAVREWLDKKL